MQLQPLRSERPAFSAALPSLARKGVAWVRPEFVAEVEFRGWTSDGLVRHASFHALPEDKDAQGHPRNRRARQKDPEMTAHYPLTVDTIGKLIDVGHHLHTRIAWIAARDCVWTSGSWSRRLARTGALSVVNTRCAIPLCGSDRVETRISSAPPAGSPPEVLY
jgi:hypothetical protein